MRFIFSNIRPLTFIFEEGSLETIRKSFFYALFLEFFRESICFRLLWKFHLNKHLIYNFFRMDRYAFLTLFRRKTKIKIELKILYFSRERASIHSQKCQFSLWTLPLVSRKCGTKVMCNKRNVFIKLNVSTFWNFKWIAEACVNILFMIHDQNQKKTICVEYTWGFISWHNHFKNCAVCKFITIHWDHSVIFLVITSVSR